MKTQKTLQEASAEFSTATNVLVVELMKPFVPILTFWCNVAVSMMQHPESYTKEEKQAHAAQHKGN